MSNFFPSYGRKAPLTEMSPLFHVMQNVSVQYTVLQDQDEEEARKAGNRSMPTSPATSPTITKKAPLILNRNGWFTLKRGVAVTSDLEAVDEVDPDLHINTPEKKEIISPHLAVLAVAIVICVCLTVAISSMSHHTTSSLFPPNSPSPVMPQSTKMTLIPVETVGNARSVKVVAGVEDKSTTGGLAELVLAEGVYITNYKNNGWNHLRVHMPNIPLTNDYDYFSRYFMGYEAMGFLEGFVTCQEMQNYYVNLYHGLFDGGDIMPEAVDFLVENHDWVRQQAEANWRTSEYWLAIKATLIQLTGLLNGLREGCPTAAGGPTEFDVYSSTSLRTLHDQPSLVNLLVMNANGDLYQIAAKYNQENAPTANDDDHQYTNPPPASNATMAFDDDNHLKSQGKGSPINARTMFDRHLEHIRSRKMLDKKEMASGISPRERQHLGSDHCSALIRLLPDNSDVLFAHNTWDDFQNMAPRIFKQYSFPQPHYRRAQGVSTPAGNVNPAGGGGDGLDGGNVNNGENSPQVVVGSEAQQGGGGWYAADKDRNEEYNNEKENKNENEKEKEKEKENETKKKNGGGSSSGSGSGGGVSSDPTIGTNDDVNNANTVPTTSPTPLPATQTYSVLSSTMVDIHFSSSPGFLSSVDDFYTIAGNGNLAVIETSLDIYDDTLLTQVHYDSVLSWMRVRVANQYAQSGDHWSRLFALYHSGTYVNQWLVVDFAKFVEGEQPSTGSGLLTVLEEMPGYIFWEDVTNILVSQGYWASFNDAYFEVVRQVSGAELMCETDADYCYQTDPRNLIFKQRAPQVFDIEDMKEIIRYNNWEHDPLSKNDSCIGTIACRMDLEPEYVSQYPFGALDGKVSSIKLASRLHIKSVLPSGGGGASPSDTTTATTTDTAVISSEDADANANANAAADANNNGNNNANNSPKNSPSGGNNNNNNNNNAPTYNVNFLPTIYTIMGPTHDTQPVFCWPLFDQRRDLRGKRFSHLGAPVCFDYEWIVVPPPKDYNGLRTGGGSSTSISSSGSGDGQGITVNS